MRLVSFSEVSEIDLIKFFEPECAIVPKFSTSSFSSIPMPWSEIVMVLFSSSVVILISSSNSESQILFPVSSVYFNFSSASAAFETSSLMKISLSVYSELITISRSCCTSA